MRKKTREMHNGITLLELMIAISLLALVILAGSGLYLSGWNLFKDAQYRAQSSRNALIPMMHMVNNLQQAINFTHQSATELRFARYINISSGTTEAARYIYNSTRREIRYDNGTFGVDEIPIGIHIQAFNYRISHNSTNTGLVANITITATDNRNNNPYNLTSIVEARYGGAT